MCRRCARKVEAAPSRDRTQILVTALREAEEEVRHARAALREAREEVRKAEALPKGPRSPRESERFVAAIRSATLAAAWEIVRASNARLTRALAAVDQAQRNLRPRVVPSHPVRLAPGRATRPVPASRVPSTPAPASCALRPPFPGPLPELERERFDPTSGGALGKPIPEKSSNIRQIMSGWAIDSYDGSDTTAVPATPSATRAASYRSRVEALERANADCAPPRRRVNVDRPDRSDEARDIVILRSNGRCENPTCTSPGFNTVTDTGEPVLDIDHITDLQHGGQDHPINMIAVCPNCHAAKTRGRDREALRKLFRRTAQKRHNAHMAAVSG